MPARRGVCRLATVYTPQAIIDGRDDVVGSDVASIDKRLRDERGGLALTVTVAVHDGEVQIDLGTQERIARCRCLRACQEFRVRSAG